jgi:hypothetical protein
MEFKAVDGSIYCRPALTPPITNSEFAPRVGLRARSHIDLESGGNVPLKPGSNVKLRILLDGGAKRMTCHARIHGFERDRGGGATEVYFDELSLSDEEFRLLWNYMRDERGRVFELTDTVRNMGPKASVYPAVVQGQAPARVKAVTIPVSLIERIDEARGSMRFSEFVCKAVSVYLDK